MPSSVLSANRGTSLATAAFCGNTLQVEEFDIISMFLLGLFGTGHCIGMCGPLVLAIPGAIWFWRNERRVFWPNRFDAPSRRGQTVVTPEVNTDVQDREARVLRVPDTSTVGDVVAVLNALRVALPPKSLIDF